MAPPSLQTRIKIVQSCSAVFITADEKLNEKIARIFQELPASEEFLKNTQDRYAKVPHLKALNDLTKTDLAILEGMKRDLQRLEQSVKSDPKSFPDKIQDKGCNPRRYALQIIKEKIQLLEERQKIVTQTSAEQVRKFCSQVANKQTPQCAALKVNPLFSESAKQKP